MNNYLGFVKAWRGGGGGERWAGVELTKMKDIWRSYVETYNLAIQV